MRFFTFSFYLLFSFALSGQIPNYYQGINLNLTGTALKNELSQLVTQTHTTTLTYPQIWGVLQGADLDPTNPSDTIVLLMYGYNDLDASTINDRTRSKNRICNFTGNCNGYWNREHMFAQSLATPPLSTDPPGSGTDAHNLRACDVQMNSTRNNRKYTDGSGNSGQIGQDFYPGDEWKGDAARAIMYMYLRYNTQCLPVNVGSGATTYSNEIPDIFLEWNTEDPVSELEQNRNDSIYDYQGNRNPFIDNPYLATLIWTGPTAQNFWNLDGSDIIRDPSFSEPEWIPYLQYQESNNLTLSNSIETGRFRVRDGGVNGDGDNLPTIIQRLDFQIANHAAIRRVALYSGNTEFAEVGVTSQNISFPNLNFTVPDNDSLTLTLRCSFTTSVSDGLQFSYQVIYAQTSPVGSSMAFSNGGGAVTSTSGNRNKINVIASQLSYVVQASDVQTFTAMSPAVQVECRDIAGNRDTQYSQNISLGATIGFGVSASIVATPVSGVAVFSNIQFDISRRQVTITAQSSGLTPAESSIFAVFETILGWDWAGLTSYGPSPYAPTTNAAGVLSAGWTRGSGVTTVGTAGLNAWGGNGLNAASASAAATAQDEVYFTFSIPSGKVLYNKSFRPYNVRVSSTAATTGQWQYSINSGQYVNLGSEITWGTNYTSGGNSQSAINLESIPALQGLTSSATISFRLLLWGGTTTSGNWYFNAFQAGDDLILDGFLENGSQPSHYFRSLASGQWDNASNWESSGDGVTWFPATLFPGVMAQSIQIRNGHTIQVSNVQGASHLTTDAGASLLVVTGGNLTVQD